MRFSRASIALWLVALAWVLSGESGHAIITRLTPLREVLRAEQFIITAKVEKLNRAGASAVLKVEEELKGKVPFRTLAASLIGDSQGQREHDPERLLKRLTTDLPLVLFISKRGPRYTAFAFTNGSWFQFVAPSDNEAEKLRWTFTHCEPYLRRTFKGTTAELKQIIKDGLSGKAAPPEPDAAEPPGLGPEILPNNESNPKGKTGAGPILGVIPTFVIFGPLALLASLGFGAVGLFVRRWRLPILVVSVDSSLYVLRALSLGRLQESWWGSKPALWLVMTLVCVLGALWCWHLRQRVREGSDQVAPSRGVFGALCVLSLLAITGLGIAALRGQQKASETDVAWVFYAPSPGTIYSRPLLADGRLYVGVAQAMGFQTSGAVYCLDAETGQALWTFDNRGEVKQVYSSPCLAGDKIYIGEGFHEDTDCKLYCLDAKTGRKLWHFTTHSHTESSPCVADGKVYFGAGEDGLYCAQAEDGKKLWCFPGLHIDTTPVVSGNRLFGGSSRGQVLEAFCLDAATGKPLWRRPCDMPVLGSPQVAGERIYLGLGNGDVLHAAAGPAGALLCLDASSGRQIWQGNYSDAILATPLIDQDKVYFTCRDHCCYCVSAQSGRLLWKQDLGSAAASSPTMVNGTLYVAATAGAVYGLDAERGDLRWTFDIAAYSQTNASLFSSPAVSLEVDAGQRRRVYVAAGLYNVVTCNPAIYCLLAP